MELQEFEIEKPSSEFEEQKKVIQSKQIDEAKKQRTCNKDEEIVSVFDSEQKQKAKTHSVVAIFHDPGGVLVHKVKKIKQEKQSEK